MTINGEYKYLEWLRAPKGAFIDTGIVLGSKSRVVMDIKVGGAKENWFGAEIAGGKTGLSPSRMTMA